MKILLYLLIIFSIVNAQQQKQRIAVLEMESDGVSNSESVTLTNRLRSELVKTGFFTIIERGEMDEILKEQGFQLSGCTSNKCAVEAGRLLNVSQICARSIGKTPKIVKQLSVGEHQLILKMENFENYSKTIQVNFNQFTKVNGNLKKPGSINIQSNPTNADIFINGKSFGRTPLTFKLRSDKNTRIKLTKRLYSDWKKIITIKEGENERVSARLEKQKGVITLGKLPNGASITINNIKYKTDKKEFALPVGKYALEISKPGFVSKSFSFELTANKTKTIDSALEKKTCGGALRRSLFIPGWGQAYQDKNGRAWLYGLAFAGNAAGSFLYTNKYNSAVADYNTIREQYNTAVEEDEILRLGKEMNSAYDDINSNESMRNIFYAATGVVWLWNVLDTIILPPGWENKISLSANLNEGGMKAGLSFKLK